MTDYNDNILQIEGWLNVCDKYIPETFQPYGRNSNLQPSCKWIQLYCILNRKTKKFHHFPSIESANEYFKLSNSFIPPSQCLKIGTENLQKDDSTITISNSSGTNIRFNSSTKSFTLDGSQTPLNYSNFNGNDLYYGKNNSGIKCKGSSTSINSDDASSKPPTSQSKFTNFFNRKSKQFRSNLKRTKSATKLDRKKSQENDGCLSIYECDPVTYNQLSGLQNKNQQSNMLWQIGPEQNSDFSESNLKRSASLGRLSKRFFSRANFAQKSFDKKDKYNPSSEKSSPPISQLRPSHSSEILLTPNFSANGKNLSELDLTNDCNFSIHCLHPSLSTERPCFIINQILDQTPPLPNRNSGTFSDRRISTIENDSTKFGDTNQTVVCYACSTDEDRSLWLRWFWIFKDCIEKCRTYNSLKLFILEAKNLQPKKKYFCEISLNKQLFGRTTVKQMSDILFWGEQFCFNDLSKINKVEISIYREGERKKKKVPTATLR